MSSASSNRPTALNVQRLRAALVKRLSTDTPPQRIAASVVKGRKPSLHRRSLAQTYEHRLIQVVSAALLNPEVKLDVDIETYASTTPQERTSMVPQGNVRVLSEPATLVDKNGVIVLWYLPNILPFDLHEKLLKSTEHLAPLLSDGVKPKSCAPNWRVANKNFVPPLTGSSHRIQPGSINFSPGWFAQGHTTSKFPLLPSVNLRDDVNSSAWLEEIISPEEFMNSILALTHPRLFDAAVEMLNHLRSNPNTQAVACRWASVFSGIAVIANRLTPPHTDRGGLPNWYDSLASIGSFSRAYLHLPDLGISLLYRPGTVVNLCGNVIRHEVKGAWGAGDRVCYARFMRKAIFSHFGVECNTWVSQGDFTGLPQHVRVNSSQ
ncbi:hypothetical protein Hypma_009940 [Hypsizygus marmoreus]|uniref:2OGFeDO JBP1/TET oxygenase domain-containing protein n=1 Tax=Hypsizygus marmoreus TaxID=39966 RepID=A0A369JTE2_HYPMA|nr:hypothetical protein Hypma_009940 [Hypsizygus marmoreus]